MSDYLRSLLQRHQATPAGAVRPRLPSWFEAGGARAGAKADEADPGRASQGAFVDGEGTDTMDTPAPRRSPDALRGPPPGPAGYPAERGPVPDAGRASERPAPPPADAAGRSTRSPALPDAADAHAPRQRPTADGSPVSRRTRGAHTADTAGSGVDVGEAPDHGRRKASTGPEPTILPPAEIPRGAEAPAIPGPGQPDGDRTVSPDASGGVPDGAIAGTIRPAGAGPPGASDEQAGRPSPLARRPDAGASGPFDEARDARADAAGPPVIRVTIGRVEVRAEQPEPPGPRPAARPRTPPLSLEEYLKRRGGGPR